MIVLKMHSGLRFNGDGVAITNLNYISGESDKIRQFNNSSKKYQVPSENSSKQRIT